MDVINQHELCVNKFSHQTVIADRIHSTVCCYSSAITRPSKRTWTVCKQV